TFEDIVMLETRFVQNRMQAFVAQTQQLYGLIGEALQASAHGAAGAGTGATPSNPLITGLADVHNRAEEIAKMNADSAFALAEKIAKAQTLQDILTLQTQFAQEQMQAYAAQTEGLQGLIGNAFRKP
ncbi:MAG: phasin family protein, partial [Rhodomicrobium sp.]